MSGTYKNTNKKGLKKTYRDLAPYVPQKVNGGDLPFVFWTVNFTKKLNIPY